MFLIQPSSEVEPITSVVQSGSLRQAVLKSERTRIAGVLIALAVLVVAVIFRDIVANFTRHMILFVPFLGFVAAYEGWMLSRVNRAIRSDQDLSPTLRLLNVFIETQAPTVAIFLLAQLPGLGPQGALVTPALLIYFLFIILSTLRLDPKLSVLTGIFSAVGFSLVAALAVWSPRESIVEFPPVLYLSFALLLLGGGLVAAVVAKQIVGYLEGALREVELRHKMDKVEHELDLARHIQQGLLPMSPPDAGSFQVAGWNQSADQTGGDYYDWQELPDGMLAVTIADVTGHGIAPALIMAVCRAYARATFAADRSITSAMNTLNRLLTADLPTERFVTLAAALLDPATAKTLILSAGHGPLLVYEAATNTVRRLDSQGIPLGLISVIKYGEPIELHLMPGDLVLMTTDGFFEWANSSGEDFGVERIEQFLAENHKLSPDAIIEGLHREVLVFAGGTPQMDDLTAVVIKRSTD